MRTGELVIYGREDGGFSHPTLLFAACRLPGLGCGVECIGRDAESAHAPTYACCCVVTIHSKFVFFDLISGVVPQRIAVIHLIVEAVAESVGPDARLQHLTPARL